MKSPCTQASSAMAAHNACQADCNMKNSELVGKAVDADPSRAVTGSLNCSIGTLGVAPVPLDDHFGWGCSDSSSLLVWGGTSTLKLATMSGTLSLSDGTMSSINGVRGYVGYATSGCANGVCEFVLDALEGFKADHSGNYMDAAGSPGTYTLSGLDFQALHPLQGQLYQSRGAIVFPDGVGVGRFSIDGGAVDSFQLTAQTSPALFIDSVVGTLSSAGQLRLNFNFSGPDGFGSATLITD